MSARTAYLVEDPLGRVKTVPEKSWQMSVALSALTRINEIVPDVPLGAELARTLGDALGPALGAELGLELGPVLGAALGPALGT
jgi:hypothetical protein